MNVKLLSKTENPEITVANAAKLCYWPGGIEKLNVKKPEAYLLMLIAMGHDSPLEHALFTFGIEGISRSCSHQLVRHRIASYSQKSQRYVNESDGFSYITPEGIGEHPEAEERFQMAVNDAYEAYCDLTRILMNSGYAEKEAIEEARAMLPNATETKIVVTMNARTLRHFFEKRLCTRAQAEIRQLAKAMLSLVLAEAPNLFENAGPDCANCREGKMKCQTPYQRRDIK